MSYVLVVGGASAATDAVVVFARTAYTQLIKHFRPPEVREKICC